MIVNHYSIVHCILAIIYCTFLTKSYRIPSRIGVSPSSHRHLASSPFPSWSSLRSQNSNMKTDSIPTFSFEKYHGLGNDFILIDNTNSDRPILTPDQAKRVCDRNFGVGGDGVIFALPGSHDCEYTMRIYNSDGSEPQMCGNGIRCMAKFLQSLERRNKSLEDTVSYKIWTNAGVIIPKIGSDGVVTVDMGAPILSAQLVPTSLPATRDDMAVEANLHVLGKTFQATCVSMGNPHAIIYVDNINTIDPAFGVIGPEVERHPMFPERVNVEFVQVLSPNHVTLKVWERGAGPTLACGTGACAVAVAGVLTGRNDRVCKVTLPGGDLDIKWDATDNHVYMTGPAQFVFGGRI